MKNGVRVKRACINDMNERWKNSEPCGIQSSDLRISGPENNTAIDVAVGEIHTGNEFNLPQVSKVIIWTENS